MLLRRAQGLGLAKFLTSLMKQFLVAMIYFAQTIFIFKVKMSFLTNFKIGIQNQFYNPDKIIQGGFL